MNFIVISDSEAFYKLADQHVLPKILDCGVTVVIPQRLADRLMLTRYRETVRKAPFMIAGGAEVEAIAAKLGIEPDDEVLT